MRVGGWGAEAWPRARTHRPQQQRHMRGAARCARRPGPNQRNTSHPSRAMQCRLPADQVTPGGGARTRTRTSTFRPTRYCPPCPLSACLPLRTARPPARPHLSSRRPTSPSTWRRARMRLTAVPMLATCGRSSKICRACAVRWCCCREKRGSAGAGASARNKQVAAGGGGRCHRQGGAGPGLGFLDQVGKPPTQPLIPWHAHNLGTHSARPPHMHASSTRVSTTTALPAHHEGQV